jgi:hypothetical protein
LIVAEAVGSVLNPRVGLIMRASRISPTMEPAAGLSKIRPPRRRDRRCLARADRCRPQSPAIRTAPGPRHRAPYPLDLGLPPLTRCATFAQARQRMADASWASYDPA